MCSLASQLVLRALRHLDPALELRVLSLEQPEAQPDRVRVEEWTSDAPRWETCEEVGLDAVPALLGVDYDRSVPNLWQFFAFDFREKCQVDRLLTIQGVGGSAQTQHFLCSEITFRGTRIPPGSVQGSLAFMAANLLHEARTATRSYLLPSWPDLLRHAAGLALHTAARPDPIGPGTPPASETPLFLWLDAIAAMPYEGRPASGRRLVICSPRCQVRVDVPFASPLSLERDARAIRKLLEVTNDTVALASRDGIHVHGLIEGVCDSNWDDVISRPDALPHERPLGSLIRFTGRSEWEAHGIGRRLFHSRNGIPTLPQSLYEEENFHADFARVFGNPAPDAAWRVVSQAMEASHGALVVFAQEADQHLTGFAEQAVVFEDPLSDSSDALLRGLCEIDGALLVDPLGRLHAAGVILDGEAGSGEESRARGSRFNSAARYVHAKPGVLALVVSEDRTVDVLPR